MKRIARTLSGVLCSLLICTLGWAERGSHLPPGKPVPPIPKPPREVVRPQDVEALTKVLNEVLLMTSRAGKATNPATLELLAQKSAAQIAEGDEEGGKALGRLVMLHDWSRWISLRGRYMKDVLERRSRGVKLKPEIAKNLVDMVDSVIAINGVGRTSVVHLLDGRPFHDGVLKALAEGKAADVGAGKRYDLPPAPLTPNKPETSGDALVLKGLFEVAPKPK